jgi:hypothetical protein
MRDHRETVDDEEAGIRLIQGAGDCFEAASFHRGITVWSETSPGRRARPPTRG